LPSPRPLALSDNELDAVMNACRPLPVERRDEFLQSLADALKNCPLVGPGVVHRVVAEQQRRFINGAWPDLSRSKRRQQWR
jgi:hypothetical protein